MISEAGKNLVFLVGAPRSGTTLLSLILSKSSQVYCPPEPWVCLPFMKLMNAYSSFLPDNCDEVLSRMALVEKLDEQGLSSLVATFLSNFYDRLLQSAPEANLLIDKTPRYYKILNMLSGVFPEAKYILINRNPLDVAASHKMQWQADIINLANADNPDDTSYDIFCAQSVILSAAQREDINKHWLRYEDLASSPSKYIKGVCTFLDIPYTKYMLDYISDNPSAEEHRQSIFGDSRVWDRSIIDRKSIDNWKQVLNREEVDLVSSVIGIRVFTQLGYDFPADIHDNADLRDNLHNSMLASLSNYSDYNSHRLDFALNKWQNTHRATRQALDSANASNVELSKNLQTLQKQFDDITRQYNQLESEWQSLLTDNQEKQIKLDKLHKLWPWMEQTANALTEACPKISIITPSLNQATWIEACVHSVLDQGYPNFEHIIIDGGSTDRTMEILSHYTHLRIIHEPDHGQAHAINKGLLASTGDVVAYLNSDDAYLLGAFRFVTDYFSEQGDCMMLVGACDLIDEEGMKIGHMKPALDRYNNLLKYWDWEGCYCIPQQSTFWKRELMTESGLFDICYHYVMDYEMWVRMAQRTVPAILKDNTLACFRIHDDSKTVSSTWQMYIEHRKAARKYWPSYIRPYRWYLELKSLYHTANKLLDVAEHEALANRKCFHPLGLIRRALLYFPPILLYPRLYLTTLSAISARSPAASFNAWFHRGYLHVKWLLSGKP